MVHDGTSSFRLNVLLDHLEAKRDTGAALAENPEALERAFDSATNYYRKLLPEGEMTCPGEIEKSEAYQYADVAKVLELACEYGIAYETEPYLVWIARMALCLPLPPFWRKKTIGEGQLYLNLEHDVITTVHPASEFLFSFIDQVRICVFRQRQTVLRTSLLFLNRYVLYALLRCSDARLQSHPREKSQAARGHKR